ncbi:MAG: FAD:protein FMN transferase [Bacteroidales bacterium]|nr:FAD:protein FMN transferase [Bacteroidales bacterium]
MKKLLLLCFLFLALACARQGDRYVQITGYAQGGTYSVKLNMKGVRLPVEALRDSVDALLLQIDTTLSGYNRKSLVARFNAGEKVPATPLFLEMYRLAREYWQRSGGLVDCAAGPVYDAWGFGFKNSRFPSEEEVSALLEKCGMGRLPEALPVEDGLVDPASLGFPQLNYNAIAQGYSCDVVARFLYRIGVKDMLVDIGEIWCDGVNPSGKEWAVGIDRPIDQPEEASEELDGIWTSGGKPCGVVTSGNYRKFYIRDGRKYAHTINPGTGYPVSHNLLSATVVSAESAADADALATWCMVLGLEEARALLLATPGLEGYLIYEDADGAMKEWASPGFTLRQ